MSKKLSDSFIFEGLQTTVTKEGRKVVTGRFQKADILNENGRIYPYKVLNKIITSENIQGQLKNRTMLGELGHPDIVETTLKEVSHIVTNLKMQQDGEVIGEAEFLDTPSGRILQTLYEAGVKLGISSRGYIPEESDLIPTAEGDMIPDDYELITFDFVLTPSTPGAYPILKEGVKRKVKKILSESKSIDSKLKEDIEKFIESAETSPPEEKVAESDVPGSFIVIYTEAPADKVIELLKELDEGFGDVKQESESIKVFVKENLVLNAAKIRRTIKSSFSESVRLEVYQEGKKVSLSNLLSSEPTKTTSSKEYISTLESLIDSMVEHNNISEQLIAHLLKSKVISRDVIESLKKRYLTAEHIIIDLRDYALSQTKELEDAQSKLSEEVSSKKAAIREHAKLSKRYTLAKGKVGDLTEKYNHLNSEYSRLVKEKHTLLSQVKVLESKLKETKKVSESQEKKTSPDVPTSRYGEFPNNERSPQRKVVESPKNISKQDTFIQKLVEKSL